MNILEMDKKELKRFVNENGWFTHFETNTFKPKKEAPEKYKNDIPDDAFYFEAVASSWAKNLNGYIIRPKAWNNAIQDFLQNWSLFYQHNTDAPLGRPLWAEVEWDLLKIGGYVTNANDDRFANGNIWNWIVRGISTGHITNAVEFVNDKTGEVLSENEFTKKYTYEDYWMFWTIIEEGWTLAVTALDWLETSFVTVPSNRDSGVLAINAIGNYLKVGKDKQAELMQKYQENKNINKNEVIMLELNLNGKSVEISEENANKLVDFLVNELGVATEEEKPQETDTTTNEETKVEESEEKTPVETEVKEEEKETPTEEKKTEENTVVAKLEEEIKALKNRLDKTPVNLLRINQTKEEKPQAPALTEKQRAFRII